MKLARSFVSSAAAIVASSSLVVILAIPATASSFDGVTSRSLAVRDPHLRHVAVVPGDGQEYEAVEGGQGFVGSEAPIVGRVGSAHVSLALVALDTRGTIGAAAWLAYVPGKLAHVAALAGGTDAYVRAGNVVIQSRVADDDAPNCCPRHVRLTTYAWRAGTLVRVSTRVARPSEKP